MHVGHFLGGEVGPARQQAAQPVPGDLYQALVGGLLQNRTVLPPEGLSSPHAEVVLGGGCNCGAAFLVSGKAGIAPPPYDLGAAFYFVS